jgi:molybdenum cofactor cytidylyltransferase
MTTPAPFSLAAVLLAGGASRRFGLKNKLLADAGGKPMVAKVAREILDGGVSELIVVTGAEHDAYVAALAGLPASFVENPEWDEGIGGSIAVGVSALPPSHAGVFIVPGDLPNLTADVFHRLAAAFAADPHHPIVVPVTAQGEQRNPVLWPRRHFPELDALSGPMGGKSLLDTLRNERLDVVFDDESLFADIDTPDDYARIIAGD